VYAWIVAELLPRGGYRFGIAIDEQQTSRGSQLHVNRSRMSSAAERGIEIPSVRSHP
jgi:hypothetical protein